MKVAIYCRLSEEDKNKEGEYSESIQNQRSMLVNYATENGWKIYKIYCDENYSGIDGTRPEYNQMLADAQKGLFDIILCKTQSRFSRNMEHIERYLNGKLQEWGIRFISVLDNVDTDVKQGKKARQINGLINEWYLEDISENVKAVLKNKHMEGISTRPFLPYGFKKDSKDKNSILIDDEAADIVRRIFCMYINGTDTKSIAMALNDEGILSPQEYKRVHNERLCIPKKNKTGIWTQQAIIRILKNRMYVGDLVHNVYSKPSYKNKKVLKNSPDKWIVICNSHDAIISRDDFKKAENRLKSRGKDNIITECGICKKRMYKTERIYNKKIYCYIRCNKCGLSVREELILPFMNKKYSEKIKKIVIDNKYSVKLFL